MSPHTLTLKNNMPLIGWGVMTLWMTMLMVMTVLYLTSGGFHTLSPAAELGLLGTFWLFGACGCAYFMNIPRTSLRLNGREVVAREIRLWSHRIERFSLTDLAPPELNEAKDTAGTCYALSVITPKGRRLTVREHHNRAHVEAARDLILAQLSSARETLAAQVEAKPALAA